MFSEKEAIRVNKILGKQAGFGPIPGNQILPWFAIRLGNTQSSSY
jgi:hypothetical protein